tara:strand:+ start:337 stop:465 length:129 start_codon:yes stop_codon:yes gene_type:complete
MEQAKSSDVAPPRSELGATKQISALPLIHAPRSAIRSTSKLH